MTAELATVLCRLFPTAWGDLSSEFQALLRCDFEAGMNKIAEERGHALPPLQRTMASFFFSFVPGKDNLYRKISQQIKEHEWDGALVTLNYERLLELSLVLEGVPPYVGSPPPNNASIELCLPHGCCHIFCESVKGSAKGISLSGTSVSTRGPVTVISDPAEFSRRIGSDAFPPVMSYFVPDKSTTSGVNFIESQRARYQELILNAEVVGIVGVAVRTHDRHLWDALANTNADVVYCSGPSAVPDFEDWAIENRGSRNSEPLPGYFSDCFDALCSHLKLPTKT